MTGSGWISSLIKDERVSEAEVLDQMLTERDVDTPGWDLDARVASYHSALEMGVDVEILKKIYGQEFMAAHPLPDSLALHDSKRYLHRHAPALQQRIASGLSKRQARAFAVVGIACFCLGAVMVAIYQSFRLSSSGSVAESLRVQTANDQGIIRKFAGFTFDPDSPPDMIDKPIRTDWTLEFFDGGRVSGSMNYDNRNWQVLGLERGKRLGLVLGSDSKNKTPGIDAFSLRVDEMNKQNYVGDALLLSCEKGVYTCPFVLSLAGPSVKAPGDWTTFKGMCTLTSEQKRIC